MIKVVVLLRRPQSWTRERFHHWWLDEHVAYGKKLPDLRKYRVCLVTGSTTHEGREPWVAAPPSTRRGRPKSERRRWPTRGRATAIAWCSSPKSTS